MHANNNFTYEYIDTYINILNMYIIKSKATQPLTVQFS